MRAEKKGEMDEVREKKGAYELKKVEGMWGEKSLLSLKRRSKRTIKERGDHLVKTIVMGLIDAKNSKKRFREGRKKILQMKGLRARIGPYYSSPTSWVKKKTIS